MWCAPVLLVLVACSETKLDVTADATAADSSPPGDAGLNPADIGVEAEAVIDDDRGLISEDAAAIPSSFVGFPIDEVHRHGQATRVVDIERDGMRTPVIDGDERDDLVTTTYENNGSFGRATWWRTVP